MAAIIFCFKKQVRRTPLCLEFGIWDLEFPDRPGPFWFRPGWRVNSVLSVAKNILPENDKILAIGNQSHMTVDLNRFFW
ncbi:MAG: hypothetical protein GTO45_25235 [Candidatus Aminicenantes bacterium]|nr:hypothetical protein [Candidatus Aminicenantes bacterium]NIM80690.1 hypothetical protein [Candidatus Aminicenantes bacterium]NIN21446.1 hypothetical protein [Candidatus Aminicenantes bacterium]NIN45258.1 hypothetical protein [Candidatus Aminicenantes bacterium]NIN88075.1 hypothetical protein [Candidatus Aminicenantes bacterium]